MTKILYALIVLTLLSNCNTEKSKHADDKRRYWAIINDAEIAIVEQDFAKASSFYDTAFLKDKHHYLKDVWNASLVAILTNDTTQVFEYLSKAFDKGLNLSYVINHHLYKQIIKDERCELRIRELFDLSQSKMANYYDSALISKLDTLHELDQCLRRQDPRYQVLRDTIQELDLYTTSRLKSIIKQTGYPSEKVIGRSSPGLDLPHMIVIFHDLQNGNESFLPILDSALANGDIHPFMYAKLYDQSLTGDLIGYYATHAFYKMDKKTIHKDYDSLRQVSLNKNRGEIGLESLEDYDKKVLYLLQNDSTFVFYSNKSISFQDALLLQSKGIDPYSDDYY